MENFEEINNQRRRGVRVRGGGERENELTVEHQTINSPLSLKARINADIGWSAGMISVYLKHVDPWPKPGSVQG